MPDVSSVLERAAASPTREPDVATPLRRRRWQRASVGAGAFVLLIVAVGAFAVWPRGQAHKVRISTPPPLQTIESHGATITLQPGWVASSEPLNWWVHSPFELFSLSTSPLPPSSHAVANDAAYASEIPRTVADNLASDGAYLAVYLWRPHEGLYGATPRDPAKPIDFLPLCALPRGLHGYGANIQDGDYVYEVTYVVGPDVSATRKADIDAMLNSLDLSGAPPTNPNP